MSVEYGRLWLAIFFMIFYKNILTYGVKSSIIRLETKKHKIPKEDKR